MKKLALALVCLVSVAFFASCDSVIENPEPSIAIIAEDGYLYDGQTIEVNEMYPYGFRAASNAETQKELSKLVITCNGKTLCDSTISGKEFVYRGEISFVPNSDDREIIGSAEIIATVTDADGKTNKAIIKVDINEEETLETLDYTWSRKGSNLQDNTGAEMALYGLQWLSRDIYHANIQPLEGCTLYVVNNGSDDVDNAQWFESIETATAKAAYILNLTETAEPVEEYRNISVAIAGDKEYNDILAIIDAEGNQHLVLIEKANVQTGNFGVWTTITAQAK